MASGPCLRRCRVVRRYMPTNIERHRRYVKTYSSIHVSMCFEPFREVSAVNTGVPCPKVPMHRKLGTDEGCLGLEVDCIGGHMEASSLVERRELPVQAIELADNFPHGRREILHLLDAVTAAVVIQLAELHPKVSELDLAVPT